LAEGRARPHGPSSDGRTAATSLCSIPRTPILGNEPSGCRGVARTSLGCPRFTWNIVGAQARIFRWNAWCIRRYAAG